MQQNIMQEVFAITFQKWWKLQHASSGAADTDSTHLAIALPPEHSTKFT